MDESSHARRPRRPKTPPPPPSPSPAPRLRRSPKNSSLIDTVLSAPRNEVFRPTIRAVDNPEARVYASSPFPSSDAQRFAPRQPTRYRLPDPPNLDVSPSNSPTYATRSTFAEGHNLDRDARFRDSLINAPSTPNPSSRTYDGSVPPSTAVYYHYPSLPDTPVEVPERLFLPPESDIDVDRLAMDNGRNSNNDRERREPNTHLSPETASNTPVPPHTSTRSGDGLLQPPSPRTPGSENRASLGAIASVASGLQLEGSDSATPMTEGSATSSGTVVRRRGFNGPHPPGFYSLFPPTPRLRPQPATARYGRSNSDPPRPLTMSSVGSLSPADSGSPVSPVSPSEPGSASRGIYSTPAHARSDSYIETSPGDVRYEIDIPSRGSSTRSRSYTTDSLPPVPPLDPRFVIPRKPVGRSNAMRWNSYMSTIQSESEELSNDGQRSSSGAGRSSQEPMGNLSAASQSSSLGIGSSRISSPYQLPDALVAGKRASKQRVVSGSSTVRFVSNGSKELPALPSSSDSGPSTEPPNARDSSGGRIPSPARSSSPSSIYSKPDYRDSAIQTDAGVQAGGPYRDAIPGWARAYYANENRNRQTIGHYRDSYPAGLRGENDRLRSLYLSRNRQSRYSQRESMAITPVVDTHGNVIAEIYGVPGTPYQSEWSPRLLHDRRSVARRRTVYIAPSIDEGAEGSGLTKRNAQVWCFALGFIFPLAWILAAFLPLPPNPRTPPASPAFERDLEKTLGPTDQARYENARWWRNINRIMSVVGVGVIIAIIVLTVVAARANA